MENMQISDLVQFHRNLEFECEGEVKSVGFVSASIDRNNLQYNFNIQVFDKDYYKENTDSVTHEIMSFFNGVYEYLDPSKESAVVKVLAYQE